MDVAAGRALYEITNDNLDPSETYKIYHNSDAVEVLPIATADATNPRIDIVVMTCDVSQDPDSASSNIASIEVVTGTPAGSPSAPSTPVNSLKLYEIAVAAGATTITNGNITDFRTFVELNTDVLEDIVRVAETAAIRADSPTWLGTITGTDTLTGSATPAPTAYAAGNRYAFVVANTNTGAVTLNINGLGAKDVKSSKNVALGAGDLVAGGLVEVRYDGTKFLMTSPTHATAAGGNKTVYIPVEQMFPISAGTAPALNTGSGGVRTAQSLFDPTTAEHRLTQWALPDDYSGGTISVRFGWMDNANASTGNVMWSVTMTALNEGNSYDGITEGTAATVLDAASGNASAFIFHKSDAAVCTIANSPHAGDMVQVEITREAANGSDTYPVDAILIGVFLTYS